MMAKYIITYHLTNDIKVDKYQDGDSIDQVGKNIIFNGRMHYTQSGVFYTFDKKDVVLTTVREDK